MFNTFHPVILIPFLYLQSTCSHCLPDTLNSRCVYRLTCRIISHSSIAYLPHHALFSTHNLLTDQCSIPSSIVHLIHEVYSLPYTCWESPLIINPLNFFHPLPTLAIEPFSSSPVAPIIPTRQQYISVLQGLIFILSILSPPPKFHIFQADGNLGQIICMQQFLALSSPEVLS